MLRSLLGVNPAISSVLRRQVFGLPLRPSSISQSGACQSWSQPLPSTSVRGSLVKRALHCSPSQTPKLGLGGGGGRRRSFFHKTASSSHSGGHSGSSHGARGGRSRSSYGKVLLSLGMPSAVVAASMVPSEEKGEDFVECVGEEVKEPVFALPSCTSNHDPATYKPSATNLTDPSLRTFPLIDWSSPGSLVRALWHRFLFICRATVLVAFWVPVIASKFVVSTEKWSSYVVWTLAKCGPAFVKLGQWAATRVDLFPLALCQTLSRLQYQTVQHSVQASLKTLREAFPDAVIVDAANIRDESAIRDLAKRQTVILLGDVIGSGSVAQVHRAVIMRPGDEHAEMPAVERACIKILHPGVRDLVLRDVLLMCSIADSIQWLLTVLPFEFTRSVKWLDMPGAAYEFAGLMRSQLDLRVEAENLHQFRRNFGLEPLHPSEPKASKVTSKFQPIVFPEPFEPFVHEDCLAEECSEGSLLTKLLTMRRCGECQGSAEPDAKALELQCESEEPLTIPEALGVRPPEKGHASDVNSEPQNPHYSPTESCQCRCPECVIMWTKATRRHLAQAGQDMFLQMMVKDNFVHSDLHPGNLIVRSVDSKHPPAMQPQTFVQESARWACPATVGTAACVCTCCCRAEHFAAQEQQLEMPLPGETKIQATRRRIRQNKLSSSALEIVVLDAGLVTTLTHNNRRNFLSVFGMLVTANGRKAAELMLTRAQEQECDNVELFYSELDALVQNVPMMTVGNIAVGPLLQRVLNIARTHKVRLDSNFVTMFVSIALLEGIGRQLQPDLSLFGSALPHLLSNAECREIMWETGATEWRRLIQQAALGGSNK